MAKKQKKKIVKIEGTGRGKDVIKKQQKWDTKDELAKKLKSYGQERVESIEGPKMPTFCAIRKGLFFGVKNYKIAFVCFTFANCKFSCLSDRVGDGGNFLLNKNETEGGGEQSLSFGGGGGGQLRK